MPPVAKPLLLLAGVAGAALGVIVDQVIQRWERRTGKYTVPR